MDAERIEKLLAQILVQGMKDAKQGEKALALSRAGFEAADIAGLLGTTAAVISQTLYERRKAGKKKVGKKK
jgi:predicted transcriptional regulator